METFLFLTIYRNSQNRLTFMAYNDYESFLLLLKNNLPAKLFLIANNFETTEQWICLKCKLFGLFTQLLNHMFFSCYIYRLRVNEKKDKLTTFDTSIFLHGSEVFRTKLQIKFLLSFNSQ